MIDFKMIKNILLLYRFIIFPVGKIIYEEISEYNYKKSLISIDDLGEEKPIFMCLLTSMAIFARINGEISEKEIEYVKNFLRFDYRLNDEAIKCSINHFNRAANDRGTIKYYAKSYYELVKGNYESCFKFASLLMNLSLVDNEFHPERKKAILNILKTLHLPRSTFDKLLFEVNLMKKIPIERIKAYGTGFIIADDGFVITNYHNIRQGYEIKVRSDHNVHEATIIHYDENADLALLKINGHFKSIPYKLESPYLGQSVFTIGFPQPVYQGFLPKISKCSICGLAGSQDDYRYLQIDANIHPGNSGGPLIDSEKGFLIGIIKAILKDANKVSYAIRPEVLQNFIDSCPGLLSNLNKPKMRKKKFKYIINDTKQSVVQIFSCKKENNFF